MCSDPYSSRNGTLAPWASRNVAVTSTMAMAGVRSAASSSQPTSSLSDASSTGATASSRGSRALARTSRTR